VAKAKAEGPLVPVDSLLFDGGPRAPLVVLAHGAGAPMDSPFMARYAAGLALAGLRAVRFEFPYMRSRRVGERRGPDREAVLLAAWREVVAHLGGGERVVIGGKSMGGRMASMVADELGVRGLLCLGYPFHPPGAPARTRTAHLENLRTPTLIIQGTRDALGSREDVAGYHLAKVIRFEWLPDGDHSFKPRQASGHSEREHLQHAIEVGSRFAAECFPG
jgi:predicted alpha/beta-hydrolase family hydrolase